jgi:hypothetical protein
MTPERCFENTFIITCGFLMDSVVLSVCETEYIDVSEVGKEILYFASFFTMWVTHKLHRLTYLRII